MKSMGLSAPWDESLENISLISSKKIQIINPMVLRAPWVDCLEMISMRQVINIARN